MRSSFPDCLCFFYLKDFPETRFNDHFYCRTRVVDVVDDVKNVVDHVVAVVVDAAVVVAVVVVVVAVVVVGDAVAFVAGIINCKRFSVIKQNLSVTHNQYWLKKFEVSKQLPKI